MIPFLTVLYAVLPVVCTALAGAAMRRVNWLTEEADASLMRVTINVFYPCLIFDGVLGNKALQNLDTLLMAPLIGFGTVILGIGVAWLAARSFSGEPEPVRRTFSVVTGIYNYGYIPLPLALALFDRETAGVLFVHNVGVEAALWSVGSMVLSGHRLEQGWRKLVNVPLIAIGVALALNLAGAHRYMPGFLLDTAKLLGQCAIPLGVILVGATIADYATEFHPGKSPRLVGMAIALRMAVLPACFLLLARYLPVSTELRHVIVLQAAMPSAVFPIVMSKHYGGDAPSAVRIVIATSLISLVSIPVVIRLGLHWIGSG